MKATLRINRAARVIGTQAAGIVVAILPGANGDCFFVLRASDGSLASYTCHEIEPA